MNSGVHPKSSEPKITIGLPTFNRPDSLAPALDHLLAQTWPNIEIIVSDNGSTDPRVAEILESYAAADKRIRLFRQSSNIGGLANFIFVLEKADADYFMWAADDDEWAPDFVSSLVPHLGKSGLVMTDCQTVMHSTGEVTPVVMPRLDLLKSQYENAITFLGNMQPSLVYGIYRTEVLRECIPRDGFDFWDCVLIFTVLMRYGITTVPGYKYRVGVFGEGYGIKLAFPDKGRLTYRRLAKTLFRETWAAKHMTLLEKSKLLWQAAKLVRALRRHLNPVVKQQQKA